jgi:hypothetical protein
MDGHYLASSSDIMGEANLRILYLPLPRFSSQLLGDLNGHGNARRPKGMAF